MKKIIIYSLLLSLLGCAQLKGFFKTKNDFRGDIVGAVWKDRDYIDQLAAIGAHFIDSEEIKLEKLSPRSRAYLDDIYYRIVRNNELLLEQTTLPQINIIKDNTIFYFSLPKGQIYLSKGLVDKYFRSEELLVACLTHEIIRSHRALYEKKEIIPVGFMKIEKLLYLTRVSTEVKVEVNKLSYYAMKRAGYDANAYLNWLQTQNKNTLDFMLQQGETRNISREELAFKNFMVLEESGFTEMTDLDLNSSSGFYAFINEIKRR